MSLFRKPKKIQRRVLCADDDEDGEPEAPPPPVISQEREPKTSKKTALLSFADEGNESYILSRLTMIASIFSRHYVFVQWFCLLLSILFTYNYVYRTSYRFDSLMDIESVIK